MEIEKRIAAFIELGDFLEDYLSERKNTQFADKFRSLDETVKNCFIYNGWFTPENVLKALSGIRLLLKEKDLKEFVREIKEPEAPKTVAVIMAGNIPAVGFHDLLCVLLSGHKILVKLSSDDKFLLPYLTGVLSDIEPLFKGKIIYNEGKLQNFEAVIATGSNNSSLYFKQYFGKYPNIIRKNRTSIAVLSGKESREELTLLGKDIFDYFGLGCRSVSKLFVPEKYAFDTFYESIFSFGSVINNKKYANNHEYNRALYLMKQEKFLDNNFLMIKEDKGLHSPVGMLYFETYSDLNDLENKIKVIEPDLQCVVTNMRLSVNTIPFGTSQCPTIFSFADNINTLAFLNNLN